MNQESMMFISKWGVCILLGSIGVFFLVMTYGALIVSRKSKHFVSGVPCAGGICIVIAFLLSPCKWLALLGFLDYGLWYLPYLLIRDLVIDKKSAPTDLDDADRR